MADVTQAALVIAAKQWPSSACNGKIVVTWGPGKRNGPVALAYNGTCTMWIATHQGTVNTCDAVVHEAGHLAGYDHTDEPGTHAPTRAGRSVMGRYGGYFRPCALLRRQFREWPDDYQSTPAPASSAQRHRRPPRGAGRRH